MNSIKTSYRIQFHKDFDFKKFKKIIPYLIELGVGTIYASPIFKSTAGSMHGYDGVDPKQIDPEIGTEEELLEISQLLKEHGIGWLQDIVPNHQGFSLENPWLLDVLEKGKDSYYAAFFDIEWNHPEAKGKLLWPVLDRPLEELIREGQFSLAYINQRLYFRYGEQLFPLHPRSYLEILETESLRNNQAFNLLFEQLSTALSLEDAQQFALQWNEIRAQLEALFQSDWEKGLFEARISEVNDEEFLKSLIQQQAYILLHWTESSRKMNYRRFFTVNELICLNIQNETVFTQYHEQIEKLLNEGVFTGLRVDHVDGLYDPRAYLHRLRSMLTDDKYLVVEKILEHGEMLPESWPVEGTTGYEFLALVNNLLTQSRQERKFTDFYNRFIQSDEAPQSLQIEKKRMILQEHMGGELDNLFEYLNTLLLVPEGFKEEDFSILKEALGEMLVYCPVYRYYGQKFPLDAEETCWIHDILDQVRSSLPQLGVGVEALEKILIVNPKEANDSYNERVGQFYARCMQYTGPLMAKGVEDTLMYVYNRFIAHNEVGDSVEAFGINREEFHRKMILRQAQTPLSLSTTATHDTKRGEDVRARLNVLSNIPEVWFETVNSWSQFVDETLVSDEIPDRNDQYFIYQTLVGTYPIDDADHASYTERLKAYLQKAFRESKRRTSWDNPNQEYEAAVELFVDYILEKEGAFYDFLISLVKRIDGFGKLNSLSQLLLKFTCPGVPDVYQGTELWDYSFVDPDNRRPVDYDNRQRILEWLYSDENIADHLPHTMWEQGKTAELKLWFTKQLMHLRQDGDHIFTKGSYIPLQVEGQYADNLLAFARVYKNRYIVVIVPLHLAELSGKEADSIGQLDWKDTCVHFPDSQQVDWKNYLHAQEYQGTEGFMVSEIFNGFPYAVMTGERISKGRSAGILMHISSLAAPFGIGDLGPEAYGFVDFLARSNQSVWQLLPLNPTSEHEHHSPYSTLSSQAGNMLLISPALLYRDGLLENINLKSYYRNNEGKVDYKAVLEVKGEILSRAYESFKNKRSSKMLRAFDDFCNKNLSWLDDYALFMVIRDMHECKPWYEWEPAYRKYDPEQLQKVSDEKEDALRYQKWIQFIFDRQWKALQKYAHRKQICLLGDIPFYVSYNSVDVWAHQSLFKVDEEGEMVGVAGVPPDAFSAEGQLWGMPTFNWEYMKERQYDWWVSRLKKNKELFDLLRFDHFRAFVDYWEVPGSSPTAEGGSWVAGPGTDFFDTISRELNGLPFVAEDLGASNPEVFRIRDQYRLPGMKVLQFAFDENFAQSPHIPHEYGVDFLVYTGTHDNNTTLGWFQDETDEEIRARIESYVGFKVDEKNVVDTFIRLIYASVAQTAILPIQDVLYLGSEAKMNRPGTTEGNWSWRLLPGQLTNAEENSLKLWTKLYNRG
ncbi:malto-oligosyltrehalose synthase [Dyadobacter tibetensis]|uniref:malto-oligosyltrehalose synthase n=1 Tax=Dyadobacter tibetensis TaxID=1211851 RepID=UPI00046F44BC|nr:malto-oligosyltrehalose synthase [Dyadobacter tibetensis]